MKDRVFPLEGVHNFRRFGDFETGSGRKVANRLYRSGQFSRASERDRETLAGLNIRQVADLRRPREREAEPSFWTGEQAVSVYESDHAGAAEPPHLVFLRESDMSFDSIREFMTQTYRRLPFDEGNKFVFQQGFRGLAESGPEDGFIVHCAAGKDRTGMFCALLLTELGVDEETVRKDYLFTNEAVDFDRITPGHTPPPERADGPRGWRARNARLPGGRGRVSGCGDGRDRRSARVSARRARPRG